MVGEVPPGATRLGLLACVEGSDCVAEARWYAEHPLAASLPTLFFAEALADPGDVVAQGQQTRRAFESALAAARAELEAGRDAQAALARAEAAMREATGELAQQSLFDLYFLRGVEAQRRGAPESTAWFARAAGVAWTQAVVLPLSDPQAVLGWKDGQHAALHARRSRLRLDAPPPGAHWAIDGVDLGDQAVDVQVFPGPHRLTATAPRGARTLVYLLTMAADSEYHAGANFPPEVDLSTVHAAIAAAVAGAPLDAGTRAALDAWASQRGLTELVVAWVDGEPRRLCLLRLAPGSAPRREGCGDPG